jgi:dienelactone hydrolase
MKRLHGCVAAFSLVCLVAGARADVVQPAPAGPYRVGCSSVEQDFTRLAPGENAQQYWEGIPAGDGRPRYVTDLLSGGATPVIGFGVPDDGQLFGKLAGKTFSVAVIVCYPTTAGNRRAAYPLPNGVSVPAMQRGGEAPIFADATTRWPVLEFSHGLAGSPLDADYMYAIQLFASNGYVVVAPFHADARVTDIDLSDLEDVIHAIADFPNYTAMQAVRALELKSTLDYLLGAGDWSAHVDADRIAGFGASLGGEALLLQAGAKLTASVGLSSQQVVVDDRLKSIATYVPYFGQPFFPAFGRDQSGIDFMNPVPVLAIAGTADTVAPLPATVQGMERMAATHVLVALAGVEHGFDIPSAPDIFTWSLMFLAATDNRDPIALARLQRTTGVAGGGDDVVILSDVMPYAPAPGEVDVVEYYNASLDHYFMTAMPVEIAILDAGEPIAGWTRTGRVFKAWPASSTLGQPVCRYFGAPGIGPATHFYSAYANECAILAGDPQWIFEGDVLRVDVPVNGVCPDDEMIVVRLYNNGMRGVANHRYTISPDVIDAMVDDGWIVEGPVFCTPP